MPSGMRTTHGGKPAVKIEADPEKPTLILRATKAYNNGDVSDRKGCNWKPGEEREINWQQFQQLMEDDPTAFERVK